MKWIIASDLHGSAHYCRRLLEAWKREEAPRMLFLGDLLYHGPRNDLPEGYAPKEVIALLQERQADIFCVRGNCEAEVDQMVLPFPVLADYCLLESAGHLIYATHGHHFNEDHLRAFFRTGAPPQVTPPSASRRCTALRVSSGRQPARKTSTRRPSCAAVNSIISPLRAAACRARRRRASSR